MTRGQALDTLLASGLSEEDAGRVVDHLAAAEAAGRSGHGMSRVPWLVDLLGTTRDPAARPVRVEQTDGFERWDGGGALGYLPLAAICDALVADPPRRSRVVVADRAPSGVLGAWASCTGLVALSATSPARLPSRAARSPGRTDCDRRAHSDGRPRSSRTSRWEP